MVVLGLKMTLKALPQSPMRGSRQVKQASEQRLGVTAVGKGLRERLWSKL